jgi:uncharacterized SAM-binding protein YcdF (DUF218 family)
VFYVYKAIQNLLRPEVWILVALAAAAWLARRPERVRLARRVAAAGMLLFLLFGTQATSSLFVRPLENRYGPPPGPLPPHDAIVVLSGGSHTGRGDEGGAILGTRSLDRLVQGLRLYRQGAAPVLVLSGGSGPVPQADSMRAVAVELGVPAAALVVERRSRTTRENAAEVRRLVPAAHRIVLVTSALHLPRAVALFRREGFAVTAVPADYLSPPRFAFDQLLPRASAIAASDAAIHEWVGLAATRIGLAR